MISYLEGILCSWKILSLFNYLIILFLLNSFVYKIKNLYFSTNWGNSFRSLAVVQLTHTLKIFLLSCPTQSYAYVEYMIRIFWIFDSTTWQEYIHKEAWIQLKTIFRIDFARFAAPSTLKKTNGNVEPIFWIAYAENHWVTQLKTEPTILKLDSKRIRDERAISFSQ